MVSGLSLMTHEWFSQQTKPPSCLTSDFFYSQYQCCKLLPPTLQSTNQYWCDRCVRLVFHPGRSPTLLNSQFRRCEILKYIKSGLSCPICISVSPVHSLDDGAFHKPNLVGADWSDLWAGQTIRWCIAWPLGSLFVGSCPMRPPPRFLE